MNEDTNNSNALYVELLSMLFFRPNPGSMDFLSVGSDFGKRGSTNRRK